MLTIVNKSVLYIWEGVKTLDLKSSQMDSKTEKGMLLKEAFLADYYTQFHQQKVIFFHQLNWSLSP